MKIMNISSPLRPLPQLLALLVAIACTPASHPCQSGRAGKLVFGQANLLNGRASSSTQREAFFTEYSGTLKTETNIGSRTKRIFS